MKLGGAVTGVAALGVLGFLLALHANAERVTGLDREDPHALPALHRRAAAAGCCGPSPPASRCCARRCRTSPDRRCSRSSIWLLIALGFHLNHAAFGIVLPFHATFLLIAFLVVGVAIPTPGMVGGFHAFYLLALTEVFGVRARDRRGRRRRRPRAFEPADPGLRPGAARARGPEPRARGRGDPRRNSSSRRCDLEVPVLRPHRGQGGGLAREQGRRRDPSPARVPVVRPALHVLRADRPDPAPRGEEGRPARALRPREGDGGAAQGLREAAGAGEGARGGRRPASRRWCRRAPTARCPPSRSARC